MNMISKIVSSNEKTTLCTIVYFRDDGNVALRKDMGRLRIVVE